MCNFDAKLQKNNELQMELQPANIAGTEKR